MSKINNWLSVDKAKGEGDAIVTLTASTYEEMYERLSNLIVKGKTKNINVMVLQRPSFKKKYFWVEFEETNKTVTLKDIKYGMTGFIITMSYSFDGINWKSVTRPYENYFSFSIEMGDNKLIYFKNETKRMGKGNWNGYCFYFDGYCKIGGDATALTDMADYALHRTFHNNPYLTDASELSLPWDRLNSNCFRSMFTGCSSLIAPPKLPATVLASYCYADMFSDCINMEYSPILSAPTLVDSCYYLMFGNCQNLKHIEMYASDITASYCLDGWVGNYSIQSMGDAGGSITFEVGVAEEGVFYKYPNTDIPLNSYNGIPTNWNVIELAEPLEELNKKYLWIELEEDGEITGLSNFNKYSYDGLDWVTCTSPLSIEGNRRAYIKTSAYSSTDQTIGFSVKGKVGGDLSSFDTLENGFNGLFENNTNLTDASELIFPWDTLVDDCFKEMFRGCTSLIAPPKLPATTLANYCYYNMFRECTSLTTAPELPATVLMGSCYYGMFYGCSNLNYIKMLATDISADYCLNNWVNGVSPTGTFVKAENAVLPTGNNGIPSGWTVENA